MASKDEYYQRIIASLQSEINTLKTTCTEQGKVIEELKSTVAGQQKEINSIQASKNPDRSSLYERLTGADKSRILRQAKTECENLIQTRLEILPSLYVNKREFDTFRTSVSKTYLPADTFTSCRKHQETRLKRIEEKLNRRFSLFLFNHSNQHSNPTGRVSANFSSIIQFFKNHNPQWLIRILVCLFILLLAFYLYSSIIP